VFKKKITKLNSQPAQYKQKLTKTIKKIIKKNYVGKHCSNLQCSKEKNYKAEFSTNSILKKNKINKNNSERKTPKNEKKKKEEDNFAKKKHVGKVKAKFSTSSILKKNRQR
jgi:hypothetical protein